MPHRLVGPSSMLRTHCIKYPASSRLFSQLVASRSVPVIATLDAFQRLVAGSEVQRSHFPTTMMAGVPIPSSVTRCSMVLSVPRTTRCPGSVPFR